jgi:hypothetical protein
MANIAATFGFQPFGPASGYVPNSGLRRRLIAAANATAIFKGDPVVSLSTGYITQATAGTTQIAGIFWGCKRYSTASKQPIWSPYWPGSDATGDVEAYIIDDPNAMFLAATRGNTAAITLANMDNNINFYAGAGGNTASGLSSFTADDSTIATTSTLPFRLMDLYSTTACPGVNGADNTTVYNWVIVRLNNTDRTSLTGI